MGRISDDEIERLKSEVSLERLVQAQGIALKKHGDNLLGRCPFHDDRTPSLVVSAKKNLWHCLGACQAGGSVIDWVMRVQGVSFRHAVELLREEHPALMAKAAPVKHGTVRKLAAPVSAEADDRILLGQVIDFYHEALKQSSEALEYLKKRGLESGELIERFKLGFANRTLGYRLPANNRQAGEAIRGRLTQLGIYRQSGHEHLSGSLVVPVFDEDGKVSEVYGRKINDNLRAGTPLHLYLPGAHRGVWNQAALGGNEEIILCEALIDAMTFWCAGYRNVTASYGVEGFTPDHLAAFKKHGTKRVLIAYDRDEAGDKAAEGLVKELAPHGIGCFRIQFPKGMDANEYAQKVQPAAKSLGVVIRHAVWMGQGAAAPREILEPAASAFSRTYVLAAKEESLEKISVENRDAGVSTLALPAQKTRGAAPPVAASPMPEAPRAPEIEAEIKAEEIVLTLGERRYRVRGFQKNLSYEQLRINLLCSRGEHFYVDTLDLYAARQRAAYTKQAASEVGCEEEMIKKDLGKVLLKLEALQEAQIKKALEPKEKSPTLSEAEEAAALAFLRDPNLLQRILDDFRRCGVVGEETNKLMGYIASTSRKLDSPLAVIIQSTSAAGKSSLMESILAFVPEEEKVKYSAMTGQSLFYMGEADLKHKILAIVEEEGAERASYALKLLQSEGELTIASTGKDPASGKLVTHEYRVEGPVMIFLTTTAIEIDEELLNRCVVLGVDEEREQTKAIHAEQRAAQTLEGLLVRQGREKILKVHKDAQRLLRPLLVANPFAKKLTFINHQTRTRRDHGKYLTLIRAVALLHQYQRDKKAIAHEGKTLEYIEVSAGDITIANSLADKVLGRSLDELPPQTRRLLALLSEMVLKNCAEKKLERADYRFTRREARAYVGWSLTQVRLHLERLLEHEYVIMHRGSRGQTFVYELCYDGKGQDGAPFLSGLIDVRAIGAADADEAADATTTATWRGDGGGLAGSWRGENGVKSGSKRDLENAFDTNNDSHFTENEQASSVKTHQAEPRKTASYAKSEAKIISSSPLAAAAPNGAHPPV